MVGPLEYIELHHVALAREDNRPDLGQCVHLIIAILKIKAIKTQPFRWSVPINAHCYSYNWWLFALLLKVPIPIRARPYKVCPCNQAVHATLPKRKPACHVLEMSSDSALIYEYSSSSGPLSTLTPCCPLPPAARTPQHSLCAHRRQHALSTKTGPQHVIDLGQPLPGGPCTSVGTLTRDLLLPLL